MLFDLENALAWEKHFDCMSVLWVSMDASAVRKGGKLYDHGSETVT